MWSVGGSLARGVPRMPSDVMPLLTAFNACSICISLPDGLNVVRLNE